MSRNNARKKKARQLMKQQGITHAHAYRLAAQNAPQPAPAPDPLEEALLTAIEQSLADAAVADPQEPRGPGVSFGEVPMPWNTVENITVQHIYPEPETLMYSVVEDYDGITKILTVNVEAEVTFEGYMHKSDYWGRTEEDEAADGIRVVDPDLNDHDVLVCFDRPVSFTYGAIVMTTGSTVEDLQFNEATVGNP